MTESSPSRPVPGPPSASVASAAERTEDPRPPAAAETGHEPSAEGAEPFADLDQLPVADHVAVFEAEHSRLQDELSTIDEV
jgi:hypothetical protein